MDSEVKLAFEHPIERAKAMHQDGMPLDRISVQDYIIAVEIGAFQSERDNTQRLQFNVALEVGDASGVKSDDVDGILSYDTITEAINAELSKERLNLLETLAERIAQRILLHPLAQKVILRIEKLDRIPGRLGVEIVRQKNKTASAQERVDEKIEPHVIFLPNDVINHADLTVFLDQLTEQGSPLIICVEPMHTIDKSIDIAVGNRMFLLAIEQTAWKLSGMDQRCVVVDNRTELDWAIKNGQISVWAPSRIILDAVDKPNIGSTTAKDLAIWLANALNTNHVTIFDKGNMDLDHLSVVKNPT